MPTKTANSPEKSAIAYPLRVQAIRSRGQNPRLYVSFPLALAAAIGLQPGETVQWELLNRGELHLLRPNAPAPTPEKSQTGALGAAQGLGRGWKARKERVFQNKLIAPPA